MFDRLTTVTQKISPGMRKAIHNVGWLTAERILSMALTLAVGIQVVRYLGPENFGKLSYGISLAGLFGAVSKLGLDSIVVRNIVRDESSTAETLGTAFLLKLIASFATIILVGCTTWTLNAEPQVHWIAIIVAFGLILQAFEVIDFWFQSRVHSKAIVGVRSTVLLLSSGIKLLLITLEFPLIAFAWLMLVDVLLNALGMIWVYFRHRQSLLTWRISWSKAKNLLNDSSPLILSAVMVTIYMKIDQVMLGNMATNESVGNYAAAVRFSEVWYFFPIAVYSSVFPAIIRTKQRDEKEYYFRLQQLYDLMAGISLVVAICVTFLSDTLITSLLGKEYTSAGAILALHVWTGPFLILGVARGKWLIVENLTQLNFLTNLIGAISNIFLNLVLIPAYDAIGAALATVLSQIILMLICLIYPGLFLNSWMLIKALFIPLRIGLYIQKK
ncbi:polysaccharide biosynthesis protein [Gloeocapsa sp. PCC 7428]|uniref:flippase n=1 Tax=Gloeocapsa sp. PCC 7428 TaxID=1173026 RepID=UPI0002A61A3D|nr:flippase [Gloeocapsa sp. PCC 7428]AFZ32186.1 polysaccharide biosynthesis protein [Gloeocapsa sp. PCC 7428]